MPLQHQPVPDVLPLPLDARQASTIGVAVQGLYLHHMAPQQSLQGGPRLFPSVLAQLWRIQALQANFLGLRTVERLNPQRVAVADMGHARLP